MKNGLPSYHKSTVKKILFLALVSLLLTGCAGIVKTEQPSVIDWASLSEVQTVGQTFVAKFDGLVGIYFYLSPQTSGNGQIKLHLRSNSEDVDDLAISSNALSINEIKNPGFYGFFFMPQQFSNQTYYYAHMEMVGSGNVQVGEAGGDTYLDGSMYQNGTPVDAQAAFQLSYSRRNAILGLGREVLNWAGILAVGFFLFLLPGWGLFSLLWPGWGRLNWPEKLGLSAGLSLAIYPLLLLWTDIIGLHLGPIYAWLPPLIGLGMVLWKNRKQFQAITLIHPHISGFKKANQTIWPDIAFLVVLALLIFTRFWVIRSLEMPMWGDSYQHTMIAQLLMDHGGLFKSWQPYAELTTFTYHFGFHSAAAVFDWITHLDMPNAVLWVGQLTNVLAVITLYPIATKIGRSRWAGVLTVLVAGLLSPMPMFYVNWGRYTQLAGQVILPGTIYLVWSILETKEQTGEKIALPGSVFSRLRSRIPLDLGEMALAWIILGGLALTHYRILIFSGLFFVAFFLLNINRDTWRRLLVQTLWIGTGAGLLFLPWFLNTFVGKITLNFAKNLSTPAAAVSTWTQAYNAIGNLSSYLPTLLWLLLPISIAWGFWRREKGVALISLWWFLILLAANPQWFRLPGEGSLSNFAVFIAAYMPVSVLAGYMLGQVAGHILQVKKPLAIVLLVSIFVIAAWGARERLSDLQVKSGVLVTRPDRRAEAWIEKNRPSNARFLVNFFFTSGGSTIVGSDAGWWLPLLARRQTTLPPLTYSAEQGPRPDYFSWVNKLAIEIRDKGITSPDVLAFLRARDVTHIFIGQRQGQVNYNGPLTLAPDQLLANSNFRLVYHQDRVWVFQIKPVPR